MEHVLLVVQMIVALFLIGCVLVQRSDSDGLGGLGAGGGSGLFSSRGQANLMTRATAILAATFMFNSLLLGIITARSGTDSLVNELVAEQPAAIEAPKDGVKVAPDAVPAPTSEAVPTTEAPKDTAPAALAPVLDKAAPDATPVTQAPKAE
jgi:preprotein translocase subunit SecG